MKKLFTLLFTAALAFSLAMPVFAQEASPKAEKHQKKGKKEKKEKKIEKKRKGMKGDWDTKANKKS